jgi:hypothetical protein
LDEFDEEIYILVKALAPVFEEEFPWASTKKSTDAGLADDRRCLGPLFGIKLRLAGIFTWIR